MLLHILIYLLNTYIKHCSSSQKLNIKVNKSCKLFPDNLLNRKLNYPCNSVIESQATQKLPQIMHTNIYENEIYQVNNPL
jgi:hypothetical protein